jgi:SRSO17 transposase
MTPRLPVPACPDPLEAFAARFDDLFTRRSQREGFRRYLEGLLLGQERNKTLTALANAEPVVGAQNPGVQALHGFLTDSGWQADRINARRKAMLLATPQTAPTPEGVLVIDETGDRKDGKKTAHVGRQYLANLGKVDNGVVSVTSLYADARLYYPLEVEPYTPAHWFERGNNDPAFRTKPQIALELVQREVAAGTPFRAVVADCFYGENDTFRSGLGQVEGVPVGFVLALKRSHCWWHREQEEVGSLLEAAEGAGWESAEQTGQWRSVARTFTDGHEETWWALEVQGERVRAYGPERATRAVIATTDPAHLPEASTWFLTTNLPAPGSEHAKTSDLVPADLTEVVRLYGLRIWVEQSYKQVKHALGWAQYQVRADRAMRRHWTLVLCAFSFVWWTRFPSFRVPCSTSGTSLASPAPDRLPARGEKEPDFAAARSLPALLAGVLAGGFAGGALLAGALDAPAAVLAGVERSAASRAVGSPAGKRAAGKRALSVR